MLGYVSSDPYLAVRLLSDGSCELVADHRTIAARAHALAAVVGVSIRFVVGQFAGCARAIHAERTVAFDFACASSLVVDYGGDAIDLALAHELGHILTPQLRGRGAERTADRLAAQLLVRIGWHPQRVIAAAAHVFAGTKDDGVHDAGAKRVKHIAVHAWTAFVASQR